MRGWAEGARAAGREMLMQQRSAARARALAVRCTPGGGARWIAAAGPRKLGHAVVIGGGALGSLVAGRLGALRALEGRVWMLTAWDEQAAAVEENRGVVVEEAGTVGSDCLIGHVRVARGLPQMLDMQKDAVSSAAGGSVEVVIIAVKQPAVRQAAQRAAAILANVHGGVCITLLNGLGHIEIIRNAFRQNDVFATLVHGVFTGGAHMAAPGVVRHVGQGVLSLAVVGGEPDPLSQESIKRIQTALTDSGIDTQVVSHVLPLAWEKLCVNVGINGLTALLRVPNGRLLDSPDSRRILADAVTEAHRVAARVLARRLGEEEAARCPLVAGGCGPLVQRVMDVAAQTRDNTSSMLSGTCCIPVARVWCPAAACGVAVCAVASDLRAARVRPVVVCPAGECLQEYNLRQTPISSCATASPPARPPARMHDRPHARSPARPPVRTYARTHARMHARSLAAPVRWCVGASNVRMWQMGAHKR